MALQWRYNLAMKPESVKRLRKLLKLTQAQAATQTGVSYQSVRAWESGRIDPNSTSAKRLAYIAALRELRQQQKGAKQ